MKDFRSLMVWEKAHKLTLKIYQITELFQTRTIWGYRSNSTGGSFDPNQYFRRLWKRYRSRVKAFLSYRHGFVQRTGVSSIACT